MRCRQGVTRRRFLGSLAGVAALFASPPLHARYLEPWWFEVTRTRLTGHRRRWHRPLRIALMSDFHASAVVPYGLIEKAFRIAIRQAPDLVCLCGDFITGPLRDPDAYREVLRLLASRVPVVASLGNHDGGQWRDGRYALKDSGPLREVLRAAGVRLLHNRGVAVESEGRTLTVVGLGDLWTGECFPERALRPAGEVPSHPTVVLSHNPDTKTLLQRFAWDLLLCGHTHGGQVVLPLLGPRFAPVRDKRFIAGLYQWAGRPLYITRGVGNLHGVRFNCRPEVSIIEWDP